MRMVSRLFSMPSRVLLAYCCYCMVVLGSVEGRKLSGCLGFLARSHRRQEKMMYRREQVVGWLTLRVLVPFDLAVLKQRSRVCGDRLRYGVEQGKEPLSVMSSAGQVVAGSNYEATPAQHTSVALQSQRMKSRDCSQGTEVKGGHRR